MHASFPLWLDMCFRTSISPAASSDTFLNVSTAFTAAWRLLLSGAFSCYNVFASLVTFCKIGKKYKKETAASYSSVLFVVVIWKPQLKMQIHLMNHIMRANKILKKWVYRYVINQFVPSFIHQRDNRRWLGWCCLLPIRIRSSNLNIIINKSATTLMNQYWYAPTCLSKWGLNI